MMVSPGGSEGVVRAVDVLRQTCLALPEVEERPSHGTPTFFVRGKKSFATIWADGHHDDDSPHAWLAQPDGVQAILTVSRPDAFFRPPYVGHRGWLGVRLDRGLDEDELADLCTHAYRCIAPSFLIKRIGEV